MADGESGAEIVAGAFGNGLQRWREENAIEDRSRRFTVPHFELDIDGVIAVVPDTCTCAPTRTAREYPILPSHGPPVDTFRRDIPAPFT